MIQRIRKNRTFRLMCFTLAFSIFFELIFPRQSFALTGGPSQPEFSSFTPIGATDMVSLSSGDMNYNIPLMDVGGYPINIAYNAGAGTDQEASMVGLGWSLSVGQINRNVRGIPDDFEGDQLVYENYMRPNITAGANFKFTPALVGYERDENGEVINTDTYKAGDYTIGLAAIYNNYNGFSLKRSVGIQMDLGKNASVGLSAESGPDGLSISPSLSAHIDGKVKNTRNNRLGGNVGTSWNSRQGLSQMTMGVTVQKIQNHYLTNLITGETSKIAESVVKSRSVGSAIGFSEQLYTPSRRVGMTTGSFTVNAALGAEVFGGEGQGQVTAYGTVMEVRESELNKIVRAYGYNNTEKAHVNDILDFNREKDGAFSVNTTNLPITNYTYDIYSIQGQGVSGMYRPYRNQVGYVYDARVTDDSESGTFGFEVGTGNSVHGGVDFEISNVDGQSGLWQQDNYILNYLAENYNYDYSPSTKYEKIHHKNVGDLSVDRDLTGGGSAMFDVTGNYQPARIPFAGSKFHRFAQNEIKTKYGVNAEVDLPVTSKIKRTQRKSRSQVIYNLSRQDVQQGKGFGPMVVTPSHQNEYEFSTGSSPHHTTEVQVIRNDGARYIYGLPAYNLMKREATFAVNGVPDCNKGQVQYNPSSTVGPTAWKSLLPNDQYFNRITTPGYVHTHLLTSVLSTDYQDRTGNGPTTDDFGNYTKFAYKNYEEVNTENNINGVDRYKWRVPFNQNSATYNEGLKTEPDDDQGNYVYGEKEIYLIDRIETKTHVAVFHYSPRKDGKGVLGENGGLDIDQNSYKLHKISLYSIGEYYENGTGVPAINPTPIKEVHFEYSYSLCPGVDNNSENVPQYATGDLDDHEISNEGGKLTLKKIYFTYRNSLMGKYTGYKFNYGEYLPVPNGAGGFYNPDEYSPSSPTLTLNTTYLPVSASVTYEESVLTGLNPEYNIKAYDSWGNYMPNNGSCANSDSDVLASEFQYTNQEKSVQNIRAQVWHLQEITLPSGGKISINYESDDYGYVQDKDVMRMFKVYGAGNTADATDLNDDLESIDNSKSAALYGSHVLDKPFKYIYIKVENEPGLTISDYINKLKNKPIYFRFLMNTTQLGSDEGVEDEAKYDYVTGYFQYDDDAEGPNPTVNPPQLFDFDIDGDLNDDKLLSLPVKFVDKEGGFGGLVDVNPISKASWHFCRKYLNEHSYSAQPNGSTDDIEEIVTELVSPQTITNLLEIFSGPNGALENKGVGKRFIRGKSWVRLMEPDGVKLGGGSRVKEIRMNDIWEEMESSGGYRTMKYGQKYEYKLENGKTSGVATYEPIGNKENPFVQPVFYTKKHLLAPDEENYIEKPFGESFFPSATITYSRVEVSNLEADEGPSNLTNPVVKKLHRTGKVVTEYYTSKDYPTLVDQTKLQAVEDDRQLLDNILSLNVRKHFTASQGYVVHLNDMNGKEKAQWVYAENQTVPISGVEYLYDNYSMSPGYDASSDPSSNKGKLNNEVTVIHPNGKIDSKTIGVEVDIVNDFRENSTKTKVSGVNGNLASFLVSVFPVLAPVPIPDHSQSEDQFRSVTTTKVINTFGFLKETIAHDAGASVYTRNLAWDAETGEVLVTETIDEYNDKYYTFNYPAHWYYEGMAGAFQNLGAKGVITWNGTGYESSDQNFFVEGDEIYIEEMGDTYWFNGFSNGHLQLIDKDGLIISGLFGGSASSDFEIIRSGHRNLQSAGIMNVTLMHNPLTDLSGNPISQISASTLLSSDWSEWRIINAGAVEYTEDWPSACECGFTSIGGIYNPYRMNEKGVWRTRTSRTYLTGRNALDLVTPRRQGFFNSFSPMYKMNVPGVWTRDLNDWTFVATVTKYSPFGHELENMDALNRYSAAQYGYNNMFPMAVGANTRYAEIGFDGFEDYNYNGCDEPHFSFRNVITPIMISDQSHTGKHSLRVGANSSVVLNKELNCTTSPE